ncbi:MAG: MSCRAMM family protein, partial [Acidimicrobiales bacterium]
MRRVVRALSSLLLLVGVVSVVMGGVEVATAAPAGAANGYGPGKGPQRSTLHWGGAYVLQGVPGYGYCIEPGDADPVELPWAQWYPVAYPGSPVFTNGQMAALAYFASRYEGTGFDGYAVNTTVAAIAQDVYGSAGGTTPGVSQAPAWLSLDIDQWAITFAGPWTISLSMNPASGSTFDTGNNYSGTVTVRSATGAGVGGLQLTAPPTGGAASGQISNFVWQQPTTDSAGTIPFQWNIGSIPPGGAFSAGGIGVVGGSPGISPPTYGTPGGQMMMVSGAVTGLQTGFAGTVQVKPQPIGTISIKKVVPDPSYYNAGGAVFQIRNGAGTVLDTLTTDASGTTRRSAPIPTLTTGALYDVHEVTPAPGYKLAPDQVVDVWPNQDTVVEFSGGYEEPILPAQLGAGKTDAQTGRPLAGAVFAFRFDSANNG